MVNPRLMCQKHLLGEHLETHMFAGCLARRKTLDGYITSDCLELSSLKKRHDEIVEEMRARGYEHHSPLDMASIDTSYLTDKIKKHRINSQRSCDILMERCERCRAQRKMSNKK